MRVKIQIHALSLALLIGVLAAPAAWGEDAKPDCTLKKLVTFDVTTEPDGRVSIPLGINGRNVLFTVDTGAVFSVLSDSMARRLSLRQEPLPEGMHFEFYDRQHMTTLVNVDTLTIAGASLPRWQFLVAPSSMFPSPSDGLIGANFLRMFDIDLDFANGKLNLISPDHCPGRVIYWTQQAHAEVPMRLDMNWHITIPVTLDGKSITATVDTGAADSVMTVEEARELFDLKSDDPALKPLGGTQVNGEAKARSYRYPFATMTFEGVTVQNPDIVLVPESGVAAGAPPLLLGMGVLRQLHVYIAYGEKTLYLTAAEAK